MSDTYNTQPTEGFETPSASGTGMPGEDYTTTPPTAGGEQVPGEEKLGSSEEKLGSHKEPRLKRMTPEEYGEMALKFAREAAFAATGAANMLAVKVKEFYEEQRKQVAEKTPEGVDPNFRQFVDAMPDQFKTFMDDAVRVYHDLAERGRHVVENLQSQAQKMSQDPSKTTETGPVEPFDLKEDAAATFTAEQAAAPEPTPETDVYPGEAKGEERY